MQKEQLSAVYCFWANHWRMCHENCLTCAFLDGPAVGGDDQEGNKNIHLGPAHL